ncbi:cache domain-containing protein [Halarcobacter sp.]|uniref:sensor histidine kinase n=1 Tax=Halarcobacter sp. TaxID=2321133 RepID=UPI002AAB45CF|nr:cache domain-containing protein [Halarcobacter sp.]
MKKNTTTEKTLINIIKYGAVIPIVLLSVIFTYIFIQYKNKELIDEISNLEIKFLNDNKKNVKDEVKRVIDSINYEIGISEQNLKKSLKNKVYEAHTIASNIYKEELKIGKSKEEIFKTIKNTLGSIIYNNGRGYIFIDDINGIKLLQPTNKSFEGKDFSNFKDPHGYNFVKKIIKTIKNKTETFDKYYWYKSQTDKTAYEKMSFYKYFEPYNVAIGTGEYIVDFEKTIQKRLLDKIKRIKFNDNGYITILSGKGDYLSYFKEDTIGTNGFNLQDKDGNYYIRDIINFAKEKDHGFLSYIASFKPNGKNENREKISYISYFKQWDWVILSGFYLEELKNEIKDKEIVLKKRYEEIIQKIITISFIVTLILILFSFYISRIIYNRFNEYKEEIEKEVDKTIEKEKLLIQQSKMAIMGEMIGNIAHQWKQPLNLISTSNSLIKLNKEFDNFSTPEQISEAIDNIDNSVNHLATTIDDFRNFFKPNKIKSVFKIKTVLDKTFKLLNAQFKNNSIKVITKIDDIEIYGFENELLQVTINIIKNAIDELFKVKDERILFITAFLENDTVYIKIKDNAGGIPKELKDKVFQAYFTTKGDKGTGIGLYMCKQIITNIDGDITVKNVDYSYKDVDYKGAEFIITLPFQSSF